MAGGEGTRLRPLTCDCPKPMLRLMGRPLMEYAVELAKGLGIKELAATLGYLPDSIQDHFGDGSRMGVKLRCYVEKTPLGTAGSVGQARDFLDERFIVLSGDGIADLDLREAIAFHHQRHALATLVLYRCPQPQEYGMVVTDEDGRIRAFHEKPGRCDVYSDRINTGIYILEPEIFKYIPEGQTLDFGQELFPALLRDGLPLFGFCLAGYWCDVGDVGAYLRVHADALDGKIRLPGLCPSIEGAMLESGCILRYPCYIAPGARVCRGAQVGPYAFVGAGSCVYPGAGVKRSVVLDGVQIASGAQLRGCVVGSGAAIGEGAQLYEESVAGSRCCVGARAVLPAGVKLWPEKQVPEGDRPDANVVWGSRREQRFIGGALHLDSPAQASRCAGAVIAHSRPRELLLGRGGSTVAAAMWHAVAAGAMAQGVQLIDAGVSSLPQLRHALRSLHADGAMLVEEDRLLPLNQLGACLAEKEQRAILRLCERQDFSGPFMSVTHSMQSAGSTDAAYVASAAARFTADPRLAPPVALCCADRHTLELAERAFTRAGLRLRCEWNCEGFEPEPGEFGILLSPSGEEALLADEGGRFDETQRQLACAWVLLEDGAKRLILPLNATRAIETLAGSYGAHVSYPSGERAAWMNAVAQAEPGQLRLQCDGLCFALRFLSLLVEKGLDSLHWRRQLPPVYRSARMLRMPIDRSAAVLHDLAQDAPEAEMGGGLRLSRRDGGWAWLAPDEAGSRLEIIAEAGDMEAAEGMCDFYEGRLKELLAAQIQDGN